MALATIKTEFLPGTSVEAAFTEAIRLAKILSVFIEFDFNGVTCIALGNGQAKQGVESYLYELKKEQNKGVAFAT